MSKENEKLTTNVTSIIDTVNWTLQAVQAVVTILWFDYRLEADLSPVPTEVSYIFYAVLVYLGHPFVPASGNLGAVSRCYMHSGEELSPEKCTVGEVYEAGVNSASDGMCWSLSNRLRPEDRLSPGVPGQPRQYRTPRLGKTKVVDRKGVKHKSSKMLYSQTPN